MKSVSELITEYMKNPYLRALEEKRKFLVFVIKISGLAFLALYVFLIYAMRLDFLHAIWLFVPMMSGFGLYSYFITKNYQKEFKQNVVTSLVSLLGGSFKYNPEGKIDPAKYELSGLFELYYDKYEGEDYVKGELNGVSFEFSDLLVKKKATDSKGNPRWYTVFDGTFFVSGFNKSFKGVVLVYPDYSEKFLGAIANSLQKINTHGLELVKMDSPEFEREFKVFSDDQILARYVLSTSLMEKIVKFKKSVNKPLYLSFKNNMMFVAVRGNNNFKAPVFKSVTDYEYIKKMIENFYFISTLAQTLSLDRTIWSVKN